MGIRFAMMSVNAAVGPNSGKIGRTTHICFSATSSLLAAGCAYGVSAYLLRRNNPRLKWGAVALMGITAMQWVEGFLWLDGPTPHGVVNQLLTVGLIPLALLAQAWGPLFGSTFDLPVRPRRWPFFVLLILGLAIVTVAWTAPTDADRSRQDTSTGGRRAPPVFVPGRTRGGRDRPPFLLWWRPSGRPADRVVGWFGPP